MKKLSVGICMEDTEYMSRFTRYLISHYSNQIEMHQYSGNEQLSVGEDKQDVYILDSDEKIDSIEAEHGEKKAGKIIKLYEDSYEKKESEYVHSVEKYQEVDKIVDEIMRIMGDEIKEIQMTNQTEGAAKILSVYSLTENMYQLPFSATLASILSEKEKVLLIDLQENSGFSKMVNQEYDAGLEELAIMAAGTNYSPALVKECIGHLDKFDYVFPAVNTESLCEITSETYTKLIEQLCQNENYSVVILNIGTRFMGFYEFLNRSNQLFLMQKRGGIGQWREYEFVNEIMNHGLSSLVDKMIKIELPIVSSTITSCERLVEQWKWSEFGDAIRKSLPMVSVSGSA